MKWVVIVTVDNETIDTGVWDALTIHSTDDFGFTAVQLRREGAEPVYVYDNKIASVKVVPA